MQEGAEAADMATWWASVSRRCETLFGDLSKRKLQPIQNKDLEVDHEQSFLFEVKPGRRQGTCMCTYQATLSECNSYFHTPATTTPSQTPVYHPYVTLLHRNKGKNPRAQSSKTHKASTLTRMAQQHHHDSLCLLYTSPSPRDQRGSRMPSSA